MGVREDLALRDAGYIPVDYKHINDDVLSSSTLSQNSVFSDHSDASSQSSNGDSDHESVGQQPEAYSDSKLAHLPACLATVTLPQNTQKQTIQIGHPRRSSLGLRKPPSLPRQDERKVLFVNDLVDSATAAVETIWPLSGACAGQSGNSRGVLPLRRYIEETLRRSRTSYSTLQVALYYLILIKPHVPSHDFTMEQAVDSAGHRALQCGRRMFLAALILASKYLQDRNYSAKAWSKMSGLKTTEINSNERTFLLAVNWKLHIPDRIFKRWTDIVLRFASPQPLVVNGQGIMVPDNKILWRRVIPLLTPELDDSRIPGDYSPDAILVPTPTTWTPSATPTPTRPVSSMALSQDDATPTPSTVIPRYMEATPNIQPPTPPLARMGPLPTPQMTPSSIASTTPAVSVCSSRRPSVSRAMSQAQTGNFCRMVNEPRLPYRATSDRYVAPRSISTSSSVFSGLSPESMISDSTRSSRSSSFSSVSVASTGAPGQASLAQLATRRQAGTAATLLDDVAKNVDGSAGAPISILDDVEMSSPPQFQTISTRDEGIPPSFVSKSCRKRVRPTSTVDSELQANVRDLLREKHTSPMDIVADDQIAHSSVSQSAFKEAWQTIDESSGFGTAKALQPPCSLRRESTERLPICKDTGRKRACCSSRNASGTYQQAHC